MSGFIVDLELLAQLVERMAACGSGLDRVDDDLDARMKRLHATWLGQAAELHADAHRRWVAGSRQMREALQVLRTIAHTADDNYTSALRANQQMWAL